LPVASRHDSKKILITGGSGMIGRRLTTLLIGAGYDVSHLSRSKARTEIKTFLWNPAANQIEKGALDNVDVIIHLAGAGVADQRWSGKWKREILLSRTRSTALLRDALQSANHSVKTFISASGISIYGLNDTGNEFVESDAPANDFMAAVAKAWEEEVDRIPSERIRVVKVRIGVVFSNEGGALKKLAQPVKFLVGAPLGTGHQWVNWIHIDDLCAIFLKAIEDTALRGVYNAVAPHPVKNRMLTKEIATVLRKPLWLPPVPGFIIRMLAGEVATVVLNAGKVSSDKIRKAGFNFKFSTSQAALSDLLKH
jgi:uncharacterized protein (TIGR01777 family)